MSTFRVVWRGPDRNVLHRRRGTLVWRCGLDQDTLERGSIYDALERLHRVRVIRARETIRPITLDRAVARLLGVRSGSPAFAIDRRTFAESGPVEWQESLVRGDRFLYSVDLPRHPQR